MKNVYAILVFVVFLALHTSPAFAGVLPTAKAGFLNDVLNQYSGATSKWLTASMRWASLIFSGLIALEITWSLVEIFLNERQLEPFLSSLLKRIIFVGSAIFILNQTPTIVTGAIQDFINIGTNISGAAGTSTTISPDSVFNNGFVIANALMSVSNNDPWYTQLAQALPQTLAALLMLLSFAVVAAQLLLTEIQICLVVGAGAFLLGFIGSRWTLPFAETYPRMIIASGMKLISVILIVGLGNALASHWLNVSLHNNKSVAEYLTIGTSSVVYAIVAWNLPAIIQAFAGASPALNASTLISGAAANIQPPNSATSNSEGGGGSNGESRPPNPLEAATRID